MIVNPGELSALRAEWQGVDRMRERVRHLVVSTFAFDSDQSPTFGDVLYNLPLVLAFDVLTKVLLLAKQEGRFTAPGSELGDLMDGAKDALSWINWQYLGEGVKRRNEVTRSAKLYGDLQCLLYIAHIEDQLVAWDIINPPQARLPTRTVSLRQRFSE
jgi:hypothetical protein